MKESSKNPFNIMFGGLQGKEWSIDDGKSDGEEYGWPQPFEIRAVFTETETQFDLYFDRPTLLAFRDALAAALAQHAPTTKRLQATRDESNSSCVTYIRGKGFQVGLFTVKHPEALGYLVLTVIRDRKNGDPPVEEPFIVTGPVLFRTLTMRRMHAVLDRALTLDPSTS